MKTVATPLLLAALLAMHAYAAESHVEVPSVPRQLRSTSDSLDASIVPDAMVLGSACSKSRLIAVSTADDDAAVMTTTAKTASRAHESLLGAGAVPTRGASASRSTTSMVARSDAAGDAATMTRASATVVRAEDPDAASDSASGETDA